MDCNNCIHNEICTLICTLVGSGKNLCYLFKDESKFIELPCEVGDMVYVDKKTLCGWYTFGEYKNYVEAKVMNIKITKKQKMINLKPVTERTANTRYHKFYPFSSVGKTIFLTKEEAEKVLKEHKNEH